MRHLPAVGVMVIPPETVSYLVVKQDNNDSTLVISRRELPWPAGAIASTSHVVPRDITPHRHSTANDIPPAPNRAEDSTTTTSRPTEQPSNGTPRRPRGEAQVHAH